MKKFIKIVFNFIKRLLIALIILPLVLLILPLLVVIAFIYIVFDIPLPKGKEEKFKDVMLKVARENTEALEESLNSLEQNNYIDAEYLMPIIRQQVTNIQNSIALLK